MEGYTEWRNWWWWWYISTWRVLGLVKTPVRHGYGRSRQAAGRFPATRVARAASRPEQQATLHLRIGRILPFFFLLLVWYTLAPHLFVRKKARLHARQKKIHLPSVRAPLLLNLGGKGLAQTRLQANHIIAFKTRWARPAGVWLAVVSYSCQSNYWAWYTWTLNFTACSKLYISVDVRTTLPPQDEEEYKRSVDMFASMVCLIT